MSELPRGWAETTIGEVVEPYLTIDPRSHPDRQFRYIDIGSIDNARQAITEPKEFTGRNAPSRARRVVKSGDVLFSTVRTYLKNIAVVPQSLDGVLTSTGIAVLRPSSAIDGAYLFSWVRSEEFVERMSKAQDGTLYPAVRDSDVSSGSVPLPPIAEQRRIVAKLDALISGTARACDELARIPLLIEHYKQAILEKAFRGELTTISGSGSESDTDLPAEWTLPTLGTLISEGPSNGWSPRSGADATGALTLKLSATTSREMRLDDHCVKRIYELPPKDSRYWLKRGDLLIQRANTIEYVGAAAIYDGPGNTYIYPDLMMRVRIVDEVTRRYVWRYLNSPPAREYFRQNATGTAGNMPKINGETVRNLPIPMPPPGEIAAVVDRIDAAFASIDEMATESQNAARQLDHLAHAILCKAFRGELVPQNPNDEPAAKLLERIRTERQAAPARRGRRRRKAG